MKLNWTKIDPEVAEWFAVGLFKHRIAGTINGDEPNILFTLFTKDDSDPKPIEPLILFSFHEAQEEAQYREDRPHEFIRRVG